MRKERALQELFHRGLWQIQGGNCKPKFCGLEDKDSHGKDDNGTAMLNFYVSLHDEIQNGMNMFKKKGGSSKTSWTPTMSTSTHALLSTRLSTLMWSRIFKPWRISFGCTVMQWNRYQYQGWTWYTWSMVQKVWDCQYFVLWQGLEVISHHTWPFE